MKMQKHNIARNLADLRRRCRYTQEEVAERIGVSRQAVAKWESGESVPDIVNCDALAQLYDVEQETNGLYTYSRTPKFDMAFFRAVNARRAACETED